MKKEITLIEVVGQLEGLYNLSFLGDIKAIPGAEIYIFGGMLRDILMDRPWKDCDMRIVYPKPLEEGEVDIESAIKQTCDVLEKVRFADAGFTVWRILPHNSKSKVPIDLSLTDRMERVRSDFSINDIWLNMRTGELLDPHGGISDIESRRLRTVLEPKQQFAERPWELPRLVKTACQFDLEVDSLTIQAMSESSHLIEGLLDQVYLGREGLWPEVLLGNFFNGLKYNPTLFIKLWRDGGLLGEFIKFLSNKLSLTFEAQVDFSDDIYKEHTLEQRLSLFLTAVANARDSQEGPMVFEKVKHILALDLAKQFDELAVTPQGVEYIS
jgi:tRNA nucleotidyltransferase/poly(A) polymerase